MGLELTHTTQSNEIEIQHAVYQTLCYFDVFKYPLKKEEILKFCKNKVSSNELDFALRSLLNNSKIKQCEEYYLLYGASSNIIEMRLENKARLDKKLFFIKNFARFVSRFPFVRAVLISGSVSKGFFKADSDVDYFIITEPNRLWICRTILFLFKKTVLLNSNKYFCMNYFIASDNLKIPDENLFVAIEIKTTIPVFENELSKQFKKQNNWINNYCPNFSTDAKALFDKEITTPWLSRLIEKIFAGTFGEKLDNYFLRKTSARWRKRFPSVNAKDFELQYRASKNTAKMHTKGFQNKTLNAWNEKQVEFAKKN